MNQRIGEDGYSAAPFPRFPAGEALSQRRLAAEQVRQTSRLGESVLARKYRASSKAGKQELARFKQASSIAGVSLTLQTADAVKP